MNLLQIYSTPIWESSLPLFNENRKPFLDCVRNFREKHSSSIQKVSGGDIYQSPTNLTKEHELSPLFDYLVQIGIKAALDLNFIDCDVFLTAAWANFMGSKSCVQFEHVHPDTFSGVFYLQTPKGSGNLALSNLGINSLWQGRMLLSEKNRFTSDRININPTEGSIFLWPSYIPHSVEPNSVDNIERISISFNILCLPKNH